MGILTIAVPIFNMEWCLEKNLNTYADERLMGRVEVLCLNNASEDGSKAIIERFVERWPEMFHLIDRDSRGYGSSINEAMAAATGRYFRIIDADDWADTEELLRTVDALEHCEADVVLTDYTIVSLQTGEEKPVRAGDKGAPYHTLLTDLDWPERTLPSIHNTTYRTQLLRASRFYMQDRIFFVDEEYVILPYLSAKSVLYLPFNVYRYLVANPAQSTSPKNRAKLQEHRQRVLQRLIGEIRPVQTGDPENRALAYCSKRIALGIGDHFTTLLIYVEDRREGRALARKWEAYIKQTAPEFWPGVRKKAAILYALNSIRLSQPAYERLKKAILRK